MSEIPIVFGSMTFGAAGTEQSFVHDLDECQAILDIVKEHGIKEIDNSRMYGNGTSEEYLGKLKVAEQGFAIFTKIFPSARVMLMGDARTWTLSAQDVHESLQWSLAALKVDSVELFTLSAPDRLVPMEETLGALNEEYKAGKFKRLGMSNYSAEEVATACELCKTKGWIMPSVYQGVYNAITRQTETELLPTLRKYNIAFHIYNPLAGGFATGKYTSASDDAKGQRFDENRIQGKHYRMRYFQDHYFEAVNVLKPVAAKHGLTLPEIMLRWLNHHSALKAELGDRILIGASSTKHVESNLIDVEKGPLPDEVVAAVDKAWEVVRPHSFKYHM